MNYDTLIKIKSTNSINNKELEFFEQPIWQYCVYENYFTVIFLTLSSKLEQNKFITSFTDIVDNNYSSNISAYNDFSHLKKSTFISFFILNSIDIPVTFKKSKSLFTKNFKKPLLKFTNYLMQSGSREKIIKNVFFALAKIDKKKTPENHLWIYFLLLTNNYFFNYNYAGNFCTILIPNMNDENEDNNNQNDFTTFVDLTLKTVNSNDFTKKNLFENLTKILPIFSYFIYSVDKNIKKFSRGKSGKYTFIWKYVAPYKRIFLTMRWLAKSIKFYSSKTFQNRLTMMFNELFYYPEKTFAWRSKIFSHNYVFKNFRKTLMISLRTSS